MSAFTAARRAWRLLPAPLRDVVRRMALIRAARALLPARHDDVYDDAYYAALEPSSAESAPVIAETIVRELGPARVLDVGCGAGAAMAALRDLGVAVRGLEHSVAAIARCRARGLDVERFDLEQPAPVAAAGPFDVVLSMEVAEHLPARAADAYVDALASFGDVIVFTAATPGQGGVDHVNEQPHAYWIAKFAARGFAYDDAASRRWRDAWRGRTAAWYADNLMLFRRP